MSDANYCKCCHYVGFVTTCNYCEYFANGGIHGVASLPAAFWNAGFTNTPFSRLPTIGPSVRRLRFRTNPNHWSWRVCIQSAWIPKTLAHLNFKGRYNRDTTIGYAMQCVFYILAWHVCGRLARPTTANWEGLGPSKHTLRNNVGMFIYRFTRPQSGLCKYNNFKTSDYRSIGCDSKPIKSLIMVGCASSQHGFLRRLCIWIVRGGTTRTRQSGMQMQYNVFYTFWHDMLVGGWRAQPLQIGRGPAPRSTHLDIR